MLKNKTSKVKKMRGTNSHSWGHKKKHRGAGSRGGKGLSGTGARGDAQKPSVLTNSKNILQKLAAAKGVKISKIKFGSDYFGKKGFHSIKSKKQNVLSLSYIEHNFDSMVENGIILKEGKDLVLDTVIAKYDKVLGKGNFNRKIKLIVNSISISAKTKVEAAGGSVEIVESKNKDNTKEE